MPTYLDSLTERLHPMHITRRSVRPSSLETTDLLAMRLYSTPLWQFRHYSRTNKALALAKDTRQAKVNQWAAVLRTQGIPVPVGATLYGERVTR